MVSNLDVITFHFRFLLFILTPGPEADILGWRGSLYISRLSSRFSGFGFCQCGFQHFFPNEFFPSCSEVVAVVSFGRFSANLFPSAFQLQRKIILIVNDGDICSTRMNSTLMLVRGISGCISLSAFVADKIPTFVHIKSVLP